MTLLELIHKLPRLAQGILLRTAFLQRNQTYITNLPGMLPMLDKHGKQTPELLQELQKRGMANAKSIFVNMSGVILHALYLPPKNGKLICAFHGIKGNWLNNPASNTPDPDDADFNPRYRMVLLEEFARDGFGFIAFSMPGFEPSKGYTGEYNFRKACGHFASFTKKLAIKNAIKPTDIIVCGESLGGAIAAIFASTLTSKGFPPAVLSLIATFDSLIGMTHNEFPIFSEDELNVLLEEKLDTVHELEKLNKNKTFIHIVAAENDKVIPLHNTNRLVAAARALGFNVLYHLVDAKHTTWDAKSILHSKKLTHLAREKNIELAAHFTVKDLEAILLQNSYVEYSS